MTKKLTKKQKELNKKNRHKKTKMYKRKQALKELRYNDTKWRMSVHNKFNGECIICGSKKNINCHHIIPRNFIETRHDKKNGITLCAKHHKFGSFSAHKNPLWFFIILEEDYNDLYKHAIENIIKLNELYCEQI